MVFILLNERTGSWFKNSLYFILKGTRGSTGGTLHFSLLDPEKDGGRRRRTEEEGGGERRRCLGEPLCATCPTLRLHSILRPGIWGTGRRVWRTRVDGWKTSYCNTRVRQKRRKWSLIVTLQWPRRLHLLVTYWISLNMFVEGSPRTTLGNWSKVPSCGT